MRPHWDGNGAFRGEQRLSPEYVIALEAQALRKERTGLHGRLAVLLNDTALAWSNFNLERDEDRVRITNSAYTHVREPVGKLYPKEYLKHDIDVFCGELEDALIGTVAVEALGGPTERTPIALLVPSFLIEGGGTIFYGPPGRGKSYTALTMAISLDAGLDQFWPIRRAARGLYVNLERSRDSIAKRIGAVNAALGLDRTRPLHCVNARGRSLAEVADRVQRGMKETQAEVLWLDSISRAGAGDLTENAPVNRVTDLLNALSPTWAAIGHTPRGDETHIYGSVHFEAAADVMVQLVGHPGRNGGHGVGLQVTKANDLPTAGPMQILAYSFDEIGLTGISHGNPADFAEIAAQKRSGLAEEILAYLNRHAEADAATVAAAINKDRSTVSRVLSNDTRFRSRIQGKRTIYSLDEIDF